MCGIAGVFGLEDRETTGRMLDTMIHRGPDDGHLVSGARFTIGARRLSIVDVAGGRQPVWNEDNTVFAVQNGEIYNYPLLRDELLREGHMLHSRCDTEVLPHIYEDAGRAFPLRLD